MGKQPMGKAIMVQGTASSVGKSVVVTGLCRVLSNQGLRVAPFKSQNMSNNSYVTRDGLEMARAQAEQAFAARVEPSVDMNPVLLKPMSDSRSQVILHGKPVCVMQAREYELEKLDLLAEIQGSLQRLMEAHDVVVIEGAGSPAEVNLYDRDLANMLIARIADAPVILVGDIDRGGVFASFLGTLDLLHPQDRARVKALVVNKFRGDISLLGPGLTYLRLRTGLPVLGVVPYDPELSIAQEDLVPDHKILRGAMEPSGKVRVYVIHLPRVSNHTDVEPLEREPDVEVKFVEKIPQDLPDILILPGSRSTMADLEVLRATGFDAYISRCVDAGVQVIGLCGGYQMLCERLEDPGLVEGKTSSAPGLGFLPGTTVFQEGKLTTQVRATHLSSGVQVDGYEVHMGFTRQDLLREPVFRISPSLGFPEERLDGARVRGGQVWGTYLHGVFTSPEFRNFILKSAREKRAAADGATASGRGPDETPIAATHPQGALEDPYDHAANLLASHLDLHLLQTLAGLPAPVHVR